MPMAVMVNAMSTQKSCDHNSNVSASAGLNPTFHDFLGMSCSTDAPKASGASGGDFSPSKASPSAASASVGASSGGGSERQVGNRLEGVPFYGPKSDLSGSEVSNRFAGSKRSNSDSMFTVSSRGGLPQIGPDSVESLHLMKMLKNGRRPTSSSLTLQPPTGGRPDANVSRSDQSAAYTLHMGKFTHLVHQAPSNRYRDMNASPPIISQPVADEGSRTGIKGSGISGSTNACGGASKRSPSTVPATGSRSKSGAHISEPEKSSNPPSDNRHGLTSASRQMTIFYGGQAHVFDDVPSNKADVIMALAGSNGGSWPTTYSPKPTVKPGTETYIPKREKEMVTASNVMYTQDFREKLPVTGVPRGCLIIKGSRNSVQAGEPGAEEKR